jgi:hypothetical protein
MPGEQESPGAGVTAVDRLSIPRRRRRSLPSELGWAHATSGLELGGHFHHVKKSGKTVYVVSVHPLVRDLCATRANS